MVWAKAAVVLGLLLLVSAFGFGVEPTHASANPPGYSCGSAIPGQLLVSGVARSSPSPTSLSPRERLAEARCDSARDRTAWLAWSGIGVGFVAFLVGWTALREQGREPGRASGRLSAA